MVDLDDQVLRHPQPVLPLREVQRRQDPGNLDLKLGLLHLRLQVCVGAFRFFLPCSAAMVNKVNSLPRVFESRPGK